MPYRGIAGATAEAEGVVLYPATHVVDDAVGQGDGVETGRRRGRAAAAARSHLGRGEKPKPIHAHHGEGALATLESHRGRLNTCFPSTAARIARLRLALVGKSAPYSEGRWVVTLGRLIAKSRFIVDVFVMDSLVCSRRCLAPEQPERQVEGSRCPNRERVGRCCG